MRRHRCKARFSCFYTSRCVQLPTAPSQQYAQSGRGSSHQHSRLATTFFPKTQPATRPTSAPQVAHLSSLITHHLPPSLSSSLTYNHPHPSIQPAGGTLAWGSRTKFQSRVRRTSHTRSYLLAREPCWVHLRLSGLWPIFSPRSLSE